MPDLARMAKLKQGAVAIFKQVWTLNLGRAIVAAHKICRKNPVLLAAYSTCLATIVLSNSINLPRHTFFFLVLPLAVLVALKFAARVATSSIIFWAIAAYLLAIGLASYTVPDIASNNINRHFRLIPAILAYVAVIAFLASDRNSLKHLLLACCVLVATSAAINIVGFFLKWPLPPPFESSYGRLVSALGMPGYNNSTNISAPYAIYGLASLAALLRKDLKIAERGLFAMSALILLLGVFLTESRSAYTATIAGMVVIVSSIAKPRRYILYGIGAIVFIGIAASPSIIALLTSRGTSYRPELWNAFLSLAMERPLLGHGILENIDRQMADGYIIDQPHNLILSAFVRGGIWGASALVVAIGAALYWTGLYWKKTREATPLTIIVSMTTVSMLDYQLLATYPTWPWITFWFPLGICIGVEMMLQKSMANQLR